MPRSDLDRGSDDRSRSSKGDSFNASRIATTVVVPLTSNLRLAAAPGNVVLAAARSGLPKDSVESTSSRLLRT
jgi:hypothetical protein